MEKQKRRAKLWLLGVMLLVIYNFPFLSVANKPGTSPVPLLFRFLFITWTAAIAVMILVSEFKRPSADKENH